MAKIRKVGPWYEITGDDVSISSSPFKSAPLQGCDVKKIISKDTPWLILLKQKVNEWFEKFPQCCNLHKRLAKQIDFKKETYAFIPNQIVNNILYFIYSLQIHLDKDDWFNCVTEYLDYLLESFGFGTTQVGKVKFVEYLQFLIEHYQVNSKEFCDDKRLMLLEYLEPKRYEPDPEKDLLLLQETFQRWLDTMPKIGRFIEYKKSLNGKSPLNLFVHEQKHNRYLNVYSVKMKTRSELISTLQEVTISTLNNINKEYLESKIHDKKENLIILAQEKLKLKSKKLLDKSIHEKELSYLNTIINFLEILTEYCNEINNIIETDILKQQISEVNETTQEILFNTDVLRQEIDKLTKSKRVNSWIDKNIDNDLLKKYSKEIESLNPEEKNGLLELLKSYFQECQNKNLKIDKINQKLNDSNITLKQKLKISLPLFLFTDIVKYEAEVELDNKQKLPKSLAELKRLFIRK